MSPASRPCRLPTPVQVRSVPALTDTVRGHHDDASRLLPILAEQWRRAVPLIPLALTASQRGAGQPEHANRPAGHLACALAMATLPAAFRRPRSPRRPAREMP